jgi:hypothetical protein
VNKVDNIKNKLKTIFNQSRALTAKDYLELTQEIEKLKIFYSTSKHKQGIKLTEDSNKMNFRELIKDGDRNMSKLKELLKEQDDLYNLREEIEEQLALGEAWLARSDKFYGIRKKRDRAINEDLIQSQKEYREQRDYKIAPRSTYSDTELENIGEALLYHLKSDDSVAQIAEKLSKGKELSKALQEFGVDKHKIQLIERGVTNLANGKLLNEGASRHLY